MENLALEQHRERLIQYATVPAVQDILAECIDDLKSFTERLHKHDKDKENNPAFADTADEATRILASIEHQMRSLHHPAAWDKDYKFQAGKLCDGTNMPDEYLAEYALDFIDMCNEAGSDPVEEILDEPVVWTKKQLETLVCIFFAALPCDRPWSSPEDFILSIDSVRHNIQFQKDIERLVETMDFFASKK